MAASSGRGAGWRRETAHERRQEQHARHPSRGRREPAALRHLHEPVPEALATRWLRHGRHGKKCRDAQCANVSNFQPPQSRQRPKAARQFRHTAFLASSNINRLDLIPRLQLEIVRIIRRSAEAERDNVIELKSVHVGVCPPSGAKLVPLDSVNHAEGWANPLSPSRLANCSRDGRFCDGRVDWKFVGNGGRDEKITRRWEYVS